MTLQCRTSSYHPYSGNWRPKHFLLATATFCQLCGVPVRADDYACAVGIGEAELHRHNAIRFIIGARNGPPHRGPKKPYRAG